MEKIVVRVDEDLLELVPGYLENQRRAVIKMDQALQDGDYEPIRVLGHGMKGAGAGYGFDAISDIGRRLEAAATARDNGEIAVLIKELAEYLARVEVDTAPEGNDD